MAQQLAEKLHAYVRSYGNGSSRPRDLYDMLVIAERLPIPSATTIDAACRETFAIRQTDWPPQVPEPPTAWKEAWAEFVTVYNIPWVSLTAAGKDLREFWNPLLTDVVETSNWSPDHWQWLPTTTR